MIFYKYVLFYWKYYEAVYTDMTYQIPTNLFINSMQEGKKMEVRDGPIIVSLIQLVTTKFKFVRDEVTRIIMDHNSALNNGEGRWGGVGST